MIPVIIPTYRGEQRLPRVKTCLKENGVAEYNLYIRDNNVNGILYTRAMNEGMAKVMDQDERYLMLLCDDVYLRPGALSAMLAGMEANPDCGLVAPVQVDSKGAVHWAGSAWSWPAGAHMGRPAADHAYDSAWLSGACILARTECIKEIGLMDKNMRFICSDADWSFRARAAGWRCMVEPRAVVEHEFRGSASKGDPEMQRIKIEDSLYFTRKWLSGELFRRLEYPGKEHSHLAVLEEERNMERAIARLTSGLLR